MMLVSNQVLGATVSDAWLSAVKEVDGLPRHEGFHLIVRVRNPAEDDIALRRELNKLLADRGKDSVETIRNTVFPAELAKTSPEPSDLADRYRKMYPRIKALHKGNRRGTYFGRFVQLNTASGEVDQLSNLVEKLRQADDGGQRHTSRYELELGAYTAADRRMRMGFPCLSLASFHLAPDALHLIAHYRNHYLIQRAYGNYLGLGQLLEYVAKSVGVRAGELLVISGHARIDMPLRSVRDLIATAEALKN